MIDPGTPLAPVKDVYVIDIFAPLATSWPKSDCLPTVDRIDSSKPYEIGNIAIISWKANIIKNSGTAEEHRRIADWIDSVTGR